MAGVPISGLTETVRLTGVTVFTGVRDVINDSQKTNYATQGYLARGQKMSDVIQAGPTIVDDILLSNVRKARSYRPQEPQVASNPQTGTQISAPWRPFITEVAWDDLERGLNESAGSAGDRALRLKDIWFKKQMATYSDWCDFLEEQFWAVPDKTRMEATGGDMMYSIPALINEFTSGLPSAAHPGGVWTTKLGVDPAANPNWDNQRFGYDDFATGSSIVAGSFISKLKLAFQKLDFRPPPNYTQYFESPSAKPAGFIACSSNGRNRVWQFYMASQNRWENQMDPWGSPLFDNVPFVYMAALDGAAIYPTGTAAALSTDGDTNGTTNAGPRYWLIQPEYLRQIWHAMWAMTSLGIQGGWPQPTTHVLPLLSLTNLFPRSLKRHAILYPTTDIAGYPTS